jgi:hypothetical protein
MSNVRAVSSGVALSVVGGGRALSELATRHDAADGGSIGALFGVGSASNTRITTTTTRGHAPIEAATGVTAERTWPRG